MNESIVSEQTIPAPGQLVWPTVIIASSVLVMLTTLLNVAPAIRPVSALWFLLVCPGMAFVRLLRCRQALVEWTLAVALSLTLDTLVAAAMLYVGVWLPNSSLLALVVLSLIGCALQIVQVNGREVEKIARLEKIAYRKLRMVQANGREVESLISE